MTTSTAEPHAVLAARAAELARPLDEQQGVGSLDLLVVAVGGQQVAVPVSEVREVRPPGAVARVPGSTGVLTGVMGGHGDALAVAPLAALLALPVAGAGDQQWVVVLDSLDEPLGLLVDAALDIVPVDRGELSAPTEPGGLIRALLPGGVLVLDTAALLRDPRLSLPLPDQTQELT